MTRRGFMLVSLAAILASLGWWATRDAGWDLVNHPPKAGKHIIMFGDSLTAGNGSEGEDRRWPNQVGALLGVEVLNAGVPGDTTEAALARLDPAVLNREPRVVIVALGGNDVLRRIDLAATFANLDQIVARIQARGALVVLVGFDFPLKGSHTRAYADLARRRGCVLVPDAMTGVFGHPELMADQVHPNGAGYALMARRVADKLGPALAADVRP